MLLMNVRMEIFILLMEKLNKKADLKSVLMGYVGQYGIMAGVQMMLM